MPALASLEDLRAAQKDLLEAKDLDELKWSTTQRAQNRIRDVYVVRHPPESS
jgi:hypothetical protein